MKLRKALLVVVSALAFGPASQVCLAQEKRGASRGSWRITCARPRRSVKHRRTSL